jgi:DNA-binding MarR family transcriptional regulator
MNATSAPFNVSPASSGSALGLLLRQVRDNMRGRWEQELVNAGHELTFIQFITIKKLADGIAGVTELARIAEVNPGTMTRLLDQLEAQNLIVRLADPDDRRALRIRLTDAGQSVWNDIDQCGKRVHAAALAGLDDAQREHFIRLLEQVRDNLSATGT